MAMITGFFRDSFRSIVRTEAGIDRLFSFSGGCQDSLSFSRGFVDALAFLQNPRLPPGMPFVYLFIYSSEILFRDAWRRNSRIRITVAYLSDEEGRGHNQSWGLRWGICEDSLTLQLEEKTTSNNKLTGHKVSKFTADVITRKVLVMEHCNKTKHWIK